MPSPPTPEKLDQLLRETGCPYHAGTTDSVIWLQGWKAGMERARDKLNEQLAKQAAAAPASIHWGRSHARR